MKRLLPLLLTAIAAACAPVPPQRTPASPSPRLYVHILYVDPAGAVFRYDRLATAREQRNFCEVRTERHETFTRYAFTLHREDPDRLWTSL